MNSPRSSGKRVELRISKACGRRCVFCCEARNMRSGSRFMPPAEAAAIMKRMKRDGAEHITLIGGEPTLHPDFCRIAAIAGLLGYKVQVTTDGTGLARPGFAREALKHIDELCLSVHWHNESLARRISGTDHAFSDTEAAFAAIARHGRLSLFMCHTVVCSLNIGELGGIAEYVFSMGRPDVMMVSQMMPWGRAGLGYEGLSTGMRALKRALPPLARQLKRNGARLLVSGLPFCVLGGASGVSNELNYSPRMVLERGRAGERTDVLSAKESLVPPLKRIKPPQCGPCRLFDICPGVFPAYIKKHGAGEFRPVGERLAARIRGLASPASMRTAVYGTSRGLVGDGGAHV